MSEGSPIIDTQARKATQQDRIVYENKKFFPENA